MPIALLLGALASGMVFSYGTHPAWGIHAHGLELILFAKRWEWPLVALCLLLCVALAGLVIAGRRRAWWLLGLAPVMALFIHHFSTGEMRAFAIVDDPGFVAADAATFVGDTDWVVGVVFDDRAYAFPLATLYTSPVVFIQDHDRRMALFWSAFANRALAVAVTRELKGRDLEMVSMPANAPLLYNRKLGQFINALTGRIQTGQRDGTGAPPTGFGKTVEAIAQPWGTWRRNHPATLVLAEPTAMAGAPRGPVLPHYPMPAGTGAADRVTLVGDHHPVSIASDSITPAPINLTHGAEAYVVYYDPRADAVRAYGRVLADDLYLRFEACRDAKHPEAVMRDVETRSLWTAEGRAIDGEKKGTRLKTVAVADGVWGNVARWWLGQ